MKFDDSVIDPLDAAAYATVHEYVQPGTGRRGATALAPMVNIPASTISNHVNPVDVTRELGLKQARAVMLATGDHRILHQLAADVGEACVPLPTLAFPADADLLAAWADWQAKVAETVQALKQSLADGKIEMAEVRQVRRSLIEDFEMGLAMLDVLKGMAEPEA